MRSSLTSPLALLFAIFAFGWTVSCETSHSSHVADDSAYDGTADSMDSLPDCVPEIQGSSFWVREKKGAYDCMASGEWKNRKSAKKPDDADEEAEPGAWTPRMIEK
ncbi:MAG: hypothetical protein EOP07_03865 [Proteobacteria bacterium]|nr:MAG: hypothetical protein EOP07_03865 [Pseudomonadota bacterium]